jgi:hypothetical protein
LAVAAMTFDKFAWLKAVYAEPVFTPGEKAVLAHIAVFNVRTGNDILRIRQSTIADQCGISRPTVNGAIGQAELLGYLTVSERHKPAPGRNTPAEWRLLIPEPCKESEHGVEPNHVKNLSEPSKESEHGSPNHVKNLSEPCKAANSPTSENDTLNSSLNSSTKDNSFLGEVCDASPPAYIDSLVPPPMFCPEHPNGGVKCMACMDLKRIGEAWKDTPKGQQWWLRTQLNKPSGADVKRLGWEIQGRDREDRRNRLFPELERLPEAQIAIEATKVIDAIEPEQHVHLTGNGIGRGDLVARAAKKRETAAEAKARQDREVARQTNGLEKQFGPMEQTA